MRRKLDLVRSSDALAQRYRSYLRLVRPADAEFIAALRADPTLNAHLSAAAASPEQQREWIRGYQERENEDAEFYFVIVSEAQDRGVIRIYDFREIGGERSFCWGSWIIRPPRPPGLVTFSLIAVFELGFDTLAFPRAHFDVRKTNARAIALYERLGARIEAEDEHSFYYRYTRADYLALRERSSPQISCHREPMSA